MPYTVNDCFEKFRKDVVDLEPGQTKTARGSRDFVYKNIGALFQKGLLPRMYPAMNLNFGSFDRKTKQGKLDDIDLMVCYNGFGGSYTTEINNRLYRIVFDKSIPVIKDCLEEDGTLNSRKVVNQLIKALDQVPLYSMAEMHRDHEAARLQLSSYPWNFDIVPCFYTTQQFYLIPDGQGNWKNTDPRIDRARVFRSDFKYQNLATPLIRLMKYWKEQKWPESVSSYMFEQMVLDYLESIPVLIALSWQVRVLNVLGYLRTAIKNPVMDPKGIQGDLNELDGETRNKLSLSAFTSSLSAAQAIEFERNGETQKAISQWKLVFGEQFPDYGA